MGSPWRSRPLPVCVSMLLVCRGCGAFIASGLLPLAQQLQREPHVSSFSSQPRDGENGYKTRPRFRPWQFAAADAAEPDADSVAVEVVGDLAEELATRHLSGTFIDPRLLEDTKLIAPDSVKAGFRTGFVTILGSPNVGKSTLMNKMIGDRLSIVTSKVQTTRHRIMGILTTEDFQIIFSDTPGVLLPAYRLQEGMMNSVRDALGDADVLLLLTDIFEEESEKFPDPDILRRVEASGKPLVVAVNKVDLLPGDGRPGALSARKLEEVRSLDETIAGWCSRFPAAAVVPVSALEGLGTEDMLALLAARLPESPPFFADDVLSDRPQRFFAAEIIREQIFTLYGQEIPYSTEVVLDSFRDRGPTERVAIKATVVVMRDSQKGIVIGRDGAKINEVRSAARAALEKFLDRKVSLELHVKVDKDWRRNDASLRSYGYLP